jgi:hypothetical protein
MHGVHLTGMYLIGTYRPASHWHISDGCVSLTRGTVDSLALNSHSNSHPRSIPPRGGRRTLPYHVCGTVKSRPSTRRPQRTREEEEKKRCLLVARAGLPALGCLATYVGYVHTMRIHLSMLGVVSTPPQYQLIGTMSPIGVDMLAIRTQDCIPSDSLLGCSYWNIHPSASVLYLRTALGLISTKHPSWPFFQFHHM